MSQAAKAYLATQVTTTTQGDLLIMLYDAAIKFLKQAMVKMEEKNYAEKGILISRAIDIIAELANCLNKEKGGDLSAHLSQIYFFCSTQLAKANLKMKPSMLQEVINILSGLRSAYAQIVPGQENAAPAADTAATPKAQLKQPAQESNAPQGPAAQLYSPNISQAANEPKATEQTGQPAPTRADFNRKRAASAYSNIK